MKKSYEQYYTNEDLLEFLKLYQNKFPQYFSYESIGKSVLGEDIWLITLTDNQVSKPECKPAFWIEANIHASEVTGTQGALYFCERLLEAISNDNGKLKAAEQSFDVATILKKITYYILPRFSPDGARAFFEQKNSSRSTPLERPYHYSESTFKRKDLDGDGEITLMRWEDSAGAFKELKDYPGVLVPRESYDIVGEQKYYNVLPEGIFENYDGFSKVKNYDYGYDFNRQAPSFYSPEGQQKGAGEIPMEFPEPRAVVEAFRKRKNIFASNSYHTYGGFIIKTPANIKDSEIPFEDMMVMQKMGDILTKQTQYTLHSGNDDFVYNPGQALPGTFDEWYYLNQGVLGITIEYWDLWSQAKMEWKKAVEKYESLSVENMKKLMDWASENLHLSEYFSEWKKVTHPQLGEVEIGGFKSAFFVTNPPVKYLKQELEKTFHGTFLNSLMFPDVVIKEKKIDKIDNQTFKAVVIIANNGYLPTNGSTQALKTKAIGAPDIKYKITNQKDFSWIKKIENGDVKHLKGFSDGSPRISPFFGTPFSHAFEQKLEWIWSGQAQIEIEIGFYKGGILKVLF